MGKELKIDKDTGAGLAAPLLHATWYWQELMDPSLVASSEARRRLGAQLWSQVGHYLPYGASLLSHLFPRPAEGEHHGGFLPETLQNGSRCLGLFERRVQ